MTDDQIRIPELPIFKRFSLALRQEFADPSEVLSYLEATLTKVNAAIAHRERQRQAEEASRPAATDSPEDEASTQSELDIKQTAVDQPSKQETARAATKPAPKKAPRRKAAPRHQVIRVPQEEPGSAKGANRKPAKKKASPATKKTGAGRTTRKR